MGGQEFGGAGRQPGPTAGTEGHDEIVVSEVVIEPEDMAEFVGNRHPEKPARDFDCPYATQGKASHHSIAPRYCIQTIIDDKELNGSASPQGPHNLQTRPPPQLDIMRIRMFPIHPVNQWLTLGVGLEAEGQVPMSVALHLFREKV